MAKQDNRSKIPQTPPVRGGNTTSDQADGATGENPPDKDRQDKDRNDEHLGATEDEVSDRMGPGVGYDQEPRKVRDKGGVA